MDFEIIDCEEWVTEAGLKAKVRMISIDKVPLMYDDLCRKPTWYCGYVGVEENSPLALLYYNSKTLDSVYVHGGLTFSDSFDDGLWYFGFDTNHSFSDDDDRTVAFCKEECEKLAIRLVQIEKRLKEEN
jgi:hypothetical protein